MRYLFLIFTLTSTAVFSAENKVLLFAGSTRQDSVNKKLINEAARLAREQKADVTVIDLRDYGMPFYDGDLEAKDGMPAKAKQLRNLMIQSQTILIASPEYNSSLPAVLKNAIDWASRTEASGSSRDAFKGKKFGIMSASPGPGGGARTLVHLRSIIEAVGGNVIAKQVTVPNAFTAFDEKGKLIDTKLQAELSQLVKDAL